MKRFIIIFASTLIIGVVPSLIAGSSVDGLVLPKFYPPAIVFPIVWSILYIMMSISVYLATKSEDNNYIIYYINVLFNGIWTILFFGLKLRLIAFIWLAALLIIVVAMALKYYKYDKRASYLLIPYIIWLLIAAYLNLSIYLLNS